MKELFELSLCTAWCYGVNVVPHRSIYISYMARTQLWISLSIGNSPPGHLSLFHTKRQTENYTISLSSVGLNSLQLDTQAIIYFGHVFCL